jgi:hypothetical protein
LPRYFSKAATTDLKTPLEEYVLGNRLSGNNPVYVILNDGIAGPARRSYIGTSLKGLTSAILHKYGASFTEPVDS